MRIDFENYIKVPKKDQKLLYPLLIDIEDFNNKLDNLGLEKRKIYIDWQDWHNEYSPERVDPCPDFYGMYTLRFEENQLETVGEEMTIKELDEALCILVNFIEFNP